MARTDGPPLGPLALRALVAAGATGVYLVLRPQLDPGPLVAARFGLGVVLFTILLDVGRSIAGSGPPISGRLSPHEQTADPQVDEAYDAIRSALDTYVAEGSVSRRLSQAVHEAASARGLDPRRAQAMVERLEEAGDPIQDTYRPLAVRLVAGGVVSVGLALAVAVLSEAIGLVVVPPVLLVAGTSVATLQWRAQAAGARWIGLGLGLLGAGIVGLGAARIARVQPALGVPLLAITVIIVAGTLLATWRTDPKPDPWRSVESDLEDHMDDLRRAFVVTLVAGIVVFPLEPLLAGVLSAIGLPGDLALVVAMIGFVTVAMFLSLEMAGTWMALTRGRRRAERLREDRLEATETVIDRLETDRSPRARRETA